MVTKPISQNVTISDESGQYRVTVNPDGSINAVTALGATSQPFSIGGASQSISATTSSSNVSLATIGAHLQVMVTAPSANAATAFIAFGVGNTTAATVSGTPILAGTAQVFTVPAGTNYAAAITGTSTATLYFTPGDGA